MGLAMDEATREIVGFDLGDRTRAGAWGYGSLCPLSTAMRHVLYKLLGGL